VQERSENAKPPPPLKSRLSRNLSRENAKTTVKFTASRFGGLLQIMVQNFAPIGRRSSEIPWRKEKKKNQR